MNRPPWWHYEQPYLVGLVVLGVTSAAALTAVRDAPTLVRAGAVAAVAAVTWMFSRVWGRVTADPTFRRVVEARYLRRGGRHEQI